MSAINSSGDGQRPAHQSQSSKLVDSIVTPKGTFPLPRYQTPVTHANAAIYFQDWKKTVTSIQQSLCAPPSTAAQAQSHAHDQVDVNAYMLRTVTEPVEAVLADTDMLSNCATEGQTAAAGKQVQCPPGRQHSPELTGVQAVKASALDIVHRLRLGSQIRPGFQISAEVKRACYSGYVMSQAAKEEIAKGLQPVRIGSSDMRILQSMLACAEVKQHYLLNQLPPQYCEFTTIRKVWYRVLRETASSRAERLTDNTLATAATQMAVDWIQGHQKMLGSLLPFVGIDLVSDDALDIQPDMELIGSLMPDRGNYPSAAAAAAAEPPCQPLSDPTPMEPPSVVKHRQTGSESRAAGHHRQAGDNASPSGDVPMEEVEGPVPTAQGPVPTSESPAPIGKINLPRRKIPCDTEEDPVPTGKDSVLTDKDPEAAQPPKVQTAKVSMLGAGVIGSTQHWQPRSPVTQCDCESCEAYQTGHRTLLVTSVKPFLTLPVQIFPHHWHQ